MAINYNQSGVTYNDAGYEYDGASLGENYSGTVSGSTTTSGAVYGRKHPRDHIGELGTAPLGIVRIGGIEDPYVPPIAYNGTVTGTTTTSGTVVGSEGATGTVSGVTTTAGTVVGREGAFGVVTGSTTTSGSVVGTGGNVTAAPERTISFDPPRPRRQEPPQRIRRRGVVAGHTHTFGVAFGTGRAADDEQELVLLGLI